MSAPAMRIGCIAPWYGSKRSLAATIVEELGPHSAYWEPFCGSLAVLLAKKRSAHETVSDLHGDLINLAMVLASGRAGELYERCVRTLPDEGVYNRCRDVCTAGAEWDPPGSPEAVKQYHVDRAWAYMVMSWVGRNGVSGTRRFNFQMAIRWTPAGGHGGLRFSAAADSIPAWHYRLRAATILHRDGFTLLEKVDDVRRTAIYVDPPYLAATRSASKGTAYIHDFDESDHERLAGLLQRFKNTRVVVSYYDHPSLAQLYSGWTKREIFRKKMMALANGRGSKPSVAPEVLLLNGPSYAPKSRGLFPAKEKP